ncbi:TLDc domain-containing protein [Entamoeba marina]
MQQHNDNNIFIAFKTSLKEMKEDINVVNKYNLNKYKETIDGKDEDVLLKYNKWYDELSEIVVNKTKRINQSLNVIKQYDEFMELIKKEESDNDQIKITLNELVDKILEKEIKDIKFQNDIELEQLNSYVKSLLEWSDKQNYNIIFDSNVHGDGSNNSLHDKILNKSHLYFIHFDDRMNIYGGYVNEKIDKSSQAINDSNAFVFSLKRNGILFHFGLDNNDGCMDITTLKVGDNMSYCLPYSYEYNNEKKPLSDDNYKKFTVERILVIEML